MRAKARPLLATAAAATHSQRAPSSSSRRPNRDEGLTVSREERERGRGEGSFRRISKLPLPESNELTGPRTFFFFEKPSTNSPHTARRALAARLRARGGRLRVGRRRRDPQPRGDPRESDRRVRGRERGRGRGQLARRSLPRPFPPPPLLVLFSLHCPRSRGRTGRCRSPRAAGRRWPRRPCSER